MFSLLLFQQMLDDHILKAQTMHSSAYIKPFEEEMRDWEEKLIRWSFKSFKTKKYCIDSLLTSLIQTFVLKSQSMIAQLSN